jgi:hypothetical protein
VNDLLAAASDPPTSTSATVLITGLFGIIVAILTVVGTLFVERFRRSATDRRWLLDRRYEAYVGALQSSTKLRQRYLRVIREATPESVNEVIAATHELEDFHFEIELVGSKMARVLSGFLMDAVPALTPDSNGAMAVGDTRQMISASALFSTAMSLELSPSRWWWRRDALKRETLTEIVRHKARYKTTEHPDG